MTAYSLNGSVTGSGTSFSVDYGMGLLAVSYPLRIINMQLSLAGGFAGLGFGVMEIGSTTGASLSGGSALTPVPTIQGAPPSTASARGGTPGVTVSGTSTLLTVLAIGVASNPSTFEFPADYILSPGAALWTNANINEGNTGSDPSTTLVGLFTFYFEELRLAWNY